MAGDVQRKTSARTAVKWGRRLMRLLFGIGISGGLILLGCQMLRERMLGLRELQAMQGRHAVPATILSVNLQYRAGIDDTHAPVHYYRLDVHYAYAWDGRQYPCSRVRVVDDFSSDPAMPGLERQLVQCRDKGSAFTCYVNPENPAQAVLFRDLPVSLYLTKALYGWFCVLLGGMAFGALIFFVMKPPQSSPHFSHSPPRTFIP